MSWSDDMRCLYCDGKLPLYRKITHGQFCSTSHRKAYWQEQERLAVERLHQTHTSLKALKPLAPAESILGPAPVEKTSLGGFVRPPEIFPQSQGAPRIVSADPLAYEMDSSPGKPVWKMAELLTGNLPIAGLIRLLQVWFGQLAACVIVPDPRGVELVPRPVSIHPERRGSDLTLPEASLSSELAPMEHVGVTVSAVTPEIIEPTVRALRSRMPHPTAHLTLRILVVTPEIEAVPEFDPPTADALFALMQFKAAQFKTSETAAQPATIVEPLAGQLTSPAVPGLGFVKTAGMAALAGRVALASAQPASPTYDAAGNIRALDRTAAPDLAQPVLALGPRELNLAMGRGSRYPVEYRHHNLQAQEPGAMDFPKASADVVLPAPPSTVALTPSVRLDEVVPSVRGLQRLTVRFGPPATQPIKPLLSDIATIPQPLRTEHILPKSGLEPLDAKPVSDHFQPVGIETPTAPVFENSTTPKAHLWTHAVGFWKTAPRDLKLLAFAIPALLALAFHRQLPKVHVAAPAASTAQLRQGIQNVVNTQLTNVRQAVMERAGVALDEDFRAGLDDWASRGDATAGWSFDPTGFVRPGPLALYRPSMNLTDYQVQFLGMIDKKALSWVVRATDFDNYYVVKLQVLKPGPRTTVGLTRYAVINGKAENRVDTPVQIEAQPDTLYRVRLDLDGENFSLGIQGQMIDSWSEPRLTRGGIGFFTSHGEESRLRWVTVTHQYDMLGRLCAYLAPYETPTTNGSW